MIDINAEELFQVGELPKRIKACGGCNRSVGYRWATGGVRGADGSIVRLETVRVGGRLYTSHEAFRRFIVAQNRKPGDPVAVAPSVGDAAADRELAGLGM